MDGNERKRTESEARMLWNEIKKFWQENNMHISYKPLWHTLLERDMRKEDLRLVEKDYWH